MERFLQRVLEEPVMVALMAICFTLSILAFLARVKRENSPGYRKPPMRCKD